MKKLTFLLILIVVLVSVGVVSVVSGDESPIRVIDLEMVEPYSEDPWWAGAHGKVQIMDTPSNEFGWQPVLKYSVQGLNCGDEGIDRVDPGPFPWTGRGFYSLYLTVGSNPRTRLQNFNPGCHDQPFSSFVWLRDFSASDLLNEPIYVDIQLDWDDGLDREPDFDPIMVGLDIVD
jgi:hypothetical protein